MRRGTGKYRIGTLGLLLCAAAAACSPSSDTGEGMSLSEFDYSKQDRSAACEAGAKPGAKGATDEVLSKDGIYYNVRTPANYDPTVAHPLLIVYAPAGFSASANESLTRLTSAATREGFIAVYSAHRAMSMQTIQKLARLPQDVAGRWCVDLGRVYATGHSDGGTVSTAIAVLEETKGTLAGRAPSAAGFTKKDLEDLKCPAQPLPVMVMHSKKDGLFPGWGADTVKWWASCNGCALSKPPQPEGEHCVAYQACRTGGDTLYCEGQNPHYKWPGLSEDIVRFLRRGGHASLTAPGAAKSGFLAPFICRASRLRAASN
jgi:polyhydroxybutyrate depolymerase